MKTYSRDEFISSKDNKDVRLNKYISDAGICSRREADRLIDEGRVMVDGRKAVLGQKVSYNQTVSINGKVISSHDKLILIAFYKPAGIECTTDRKNPDNIIDYLGFEERIYPIGRLDKASRGLILLTNTGEIVNGILKGSNYHEKEYVVRVDKKIDKTFVKKMESGVTIDDGITTRPCVITVIDEFTFRIVLTQGLNRQIRKMCSCCGVNVIDLKRERIMNIKLGNLKEGQTRNITRDEIEKLMKEINNE